MPNPFEDLKKDLLDHERRVGQRGPDGPMVRVNARNLRDVLRIYERWDSLERSEHAYHDGGGVMEVRFRELLVAMYHKYRRTDHLMGMIMHWLKPLIEERIKEDETDARYQR